MPNTDQPADDTRLPVFIVDEFAQFTECLTADGNRCAANFVAATGRTLHPDDAAVTPEPAATQTTDGPVRPARSRL
jgi:hypothetical protein